MVDNVNEPGSVAQVATVIAEHDGNIDNISMSRRSPDFTELTIDLEVYDLKHLSAIIAQLRAKAVVAKVERVMGNVPRKILTSLQCPIPRRCVSDSTSITS